jgi:hypothetical protein
MRAQKGSVHDLKKIAYTITVITTVVGGELSSIVSEFYNFLIKPLAHCEQCFSLVTHDASSIKDVHYKLSNDKS